MFTSSNPPQPLSPLGDEGRWHSSNPRAQQTRPTVGVRAGADWLGSSTAPQHVGSQPCWRSANGSARTAAFNVADSLRAGHGYELRRRHVAVLAMLRPLAGPPIVPPASAEEN